MRSPRRSRRGAILMAALFCLVAVSMLAVVVVRSAYVEHRHLLRREQELQSQWLTESALERAAFRARIETGYTGETWRPQANESVAAIRLESIDEGRRRIVVEARFPDDAKWGILTRKELVIE